jgi:hypothetical protein
MTDQALKDAKLTSLENDNNHLQMVVKSLTSQVKARQIQAQEQFEQSANFRTSILLLEEMLQKVQASEKYLTERVQVLEKEKTDLEAKLNGNFEADQAA